MDLKARFDQLGGLEPLLGDKYVPVPEPEIVELERELGAVLPQLYRTFLLIFGASRIRNIIEFPPVQQLPPSVSSNGRGLVDMFYSARAHRPYDLTSMFEMYRARMPDRFLPIAGDGGGDQIAMIVGGETNGKIYYWNHNAEWDEEDYLEDGLPVPADLKWQNVTMIASSFDDFLNRLAISAEP